MKDEDKKASNLSLRVTPELRGRLERILELHPAMSMTGILLQCVDIALPQLEARYLPQTHTQTTIASRKAA